MTIEDIKSKLKLSISPRRYKHSESVMEVAVKLAKKYGADVNKATIAGLLHDCAKGRTEMELIELCKKFNIQIDEYKKMHPELLHSEVGAFIAKTDYGIEDQEILNAVRYHTMGRENMSLMEKIIFIADYIEPGRKFSGVEAIRKLAYNDIDKSILKALDTTLVHLIKIGGIIHPDTIKTRNYFLSMTLQ
ncbi:MAG: HD domain-containing protein [Clostridiaceae bacterium]|nr:HD domain-containing protein [Clostridiaceae bacterium]